MVNPRAVRFGVAFADGTKATSTRPPRWAPTGPTPEPDGPILSMVGGSGGPQRWESRFWVWAPPPLPHGPVGFVVEWPAYGVAETRTEVDSAVLRDAAARAEVVWDV